ncbi:helix-turn-helix transcriptional regulator [Nocardiopsis sp. NPDC057823]|uniref:helix-turn-helix transcriptional regulator n=1 Tax=Nocardiopsis sp. NPDC057823 TaxID=3346256 RepID=UPI00367287F6
MGTPLGDFIRARRDAIQPEALGLPARHRRRSPGLRRVDLASLAGISVEYLTRIEQGRDGNPSPAVVNALGDALGLDGSERGHLLYLAKITGGGCPSHNRPAPPDREVAPTVLRTLGLLEPGAAAVTNRLGDLLARTRGFDAVFAGTGLLEGSGADGGFPNLTRYVFTDPRARELFPDWGAVADEQAFDLWTAPSRESAEWMGAELAPVAGPEFTDRLQSHRLPERGVLTLAHPSAGVLHLHREVLEASPRDQQVLVMLPADEATEAAVARLRDRAAAGAPAAG